MLSITAGTLYQKRFLAPCDVRTANLVQLCAAFVVTLPLALLETEAMRWNGQLVGAMAWSVLALTLGGSSLLYLLIQRGAATAVTSLLYLVPPCTAVMAWLLFAEPITATTVAGMALAALGVSLVVRPAGGPGLSALRHRAASGPARCADAKMAMRAAASRGSDGWSWPRRAAPANE